MCQKEEFNTGVLGEDSAAVTALAAAVGIDWQRRVKTENFLFTEIRVLGEVLAGGKMSFPHGNREHVFQREFDSAVS